jgi:hypothetical protein
MAFLDKDIKKEIIIAGLATSMRILYSVFRIFFHQSGIN